MKKPSVLMKNWKLFYNEERQRYYLSGTAAFHPKLGRNQYVARTSSFVSSVLEEDCLYYETRNTIYECPLKYINVGEYCFEHESENKIDTQKKEQSGQTVADAGNDYLAEIAIACSNFEKGIETGSAYFSYIKELIQAGQMELEEIEKKEKEALMNKAKKYEDCVYLEVSNIGYGDLLAYHFGEYTGTCDPYLHVGMFQDSVLYDSFGIEIEEREECRFDFRYFPQAFDTAMSTYSWSSNIKQAVIKNLYDIPITFNNVEIAPQETKVFLYDEDQEKIFK